MAAANGAQILITGAFGCGAFRNDPRVVAEAWRDAIGGYRGWFDFIEFAVYCRPSDDENYRTFQRIIGENRQ